MLPADDRTVNHHLLSQAAAVRAKHRVQTQYRARMRSQHRLQRTIFDGGQIHQDAIFR